MIKERVISILENHRGKVICSLIGFILAVIILLVGFFKTLFIIACVLVGYYFGSKIDNEENISDILDKILPPGNFK
ncbi:protein of unknown function DUF2273 [Gottschalkia purinilytica]|uniref:Small integral membrane protein n=1 Tax=Gottschalkia purinilytica TaxID=1503 RepID=A0A0L0W7F7_GOTPU|nr:protein of unknown function DUF2273 [Gottschalkia purinilytica]